VSSTDDSVGDAIEEEDEDDTSGEAVSGSALSNSLDELASGESVDRSNAPPRATTSSSTPHESSSYPHKVTALKNPFEPRTTPHKDMASVFSSLAFGNLRHDASPKGSPRSARRLPLLPDGNSPHGSPRLPARQEAFAGLIDLSVGTDDVTPDVKSKAKQHARRQLLDPTSDDGDVATPPLSAAVTVAKGLGVPFSHLAGRATAGEPASPTPSSPGGFATGTDAQADDATRDLTSPDLEEGGWLVIP
jgi:hypothetical protein